MESTKRVCGIGPFGGVDQHQGPVGHPQHAFHFAAEIGVAGRVDDVDLHALVGNRDVLGQDGDAALALQIVGVEDLLADKLRFAELAALPQQAIDQRRLAVVDVGDDGHVADVLATYRTCGYSAEENIQSTRRGGRGQRRGPPQRSRGAFPAANPPSPVPSPRPRKPSRPSRR